MVKDNSASLPGKGGKKGKSSRDADNDYRMPKGDISNDVSSSVVNKKGKINRDDNRNRLPTNNETSSAIASAGNTNEMEQEIDSSLVSDTKMDLLLERLGEYCSAIGRGDESGNDSHPNNNGANEVVDRQRAYYLLEAAAGNVDLAATLYWDDVLASRSSNLAVCNRRTQAASARSNNSNSNGSSDGRPSKRHKSYHQDNSFGSSNIRKSESSNDKISYLTWKDRALKSEDSDKSNGEKKSKSLKSRGKRGDNNNDNMEIDNDAIQWDRKPDADAHASPPHEFIPRRLPLRRCKNNRNENNNRSNDSSSNSERRNRRNGDNHSNQGPAPFLPHPAENAPPPANRNHRSASNENMMEPPAAADAPPNGEEPPHLPLPPNNNANHNSVSISDDEAAANATQRFYNIHEEDDEDDVDDENVGEGPRGRQVSSDHIVDNHNSSNNNTSDDNTEEDRSPYPLSLIWGSDTIPSCWRQASFTSPNMCLPLPQQSNSSSNSSNTACCGGVSAILSIVLALIQSGASVQGRRVTCNVIRKRFSDLTRDERKRQFESRLADALSALLYVAASTRGRRLCPVSRWDKANNNSDHHNHDNNSMDNDPDSNPCQKIFTSYTNIRDLRAYVLSNLRSYMGFGGCALLLENIVRIHGVVRVRRMLVSLKSSKNKSSHRRALIRCDCGDKYPPISRNRSRGNDLKDSALMEHLTPECVSVELISLCLSGKMYSSFCDWETNGGLGVGVMGILTGCSDNGNENTKKRFIQSQVSRGLMHPSRPVWIVKGDRCYSTMWLENEKETEYLNASGSGFQLVHWSCWGSGKKTTVKVITARTPKIVNDDAGNNANNKTPQQQPSLIEHDLQRISHDVDDESHYPNQYKRWRFTISASNYVDDDYMEHVKIDTKDVATDVPYYRLNGRQKQMVDYKYASRINMIIWSRWKGAAVTISSPESPPLV